MLTIETEQCHRQANPNGQSINRYDFFTSPESCWLGRFGLKRVEELARTVESIHEGFTFFVYETGKLEEKNSIAFFDENFA